MRKVTYFKKWSETPAKLQAEGEPTGWFEVSEAEVRDILSRSYRDVDLIMEEIPLSPVRTPFSIFKSEVDGGSDD